MHDPETGKPVEQISSGWQENPSAALRCAFKAYDEFQSSLRENTEPKLLTNGRPSGEIYLGLKCSSFQSKIFEHFQRALLADPQKIHANPRMAAWLSRFSPKFDQHAAENESVPLLPDNGLADKEDEYSRDFLTFLLRADSELHESSSPPPPPPLKQLKSDQEFLLGLDLLNQAIQTHEHTSDT